MKKWEYTASSGTVWASFDYGEVEADTFEEAKIKAIEQLDREFKRVNDALKDCFPGEYVNIEYSQSQVRIDEIRRS